LLYKRRDDKISGDVKSFGEIAGSLAKSPLGIIALFIVLVYGFASLVTAFGQSLSESERAPLIYFLVLFPVLVLSVFAWLVSCHAGKLYPPGDYRDDSSFLQMLTVAANLGAAKTSHPDLKIEDIDLSKIASTVRGIIPSYHHLGKSSLKTRVLWVDDRPENNVYERGAFEAIGLSFSLAQSTKKLFKCLSKVNSQQLSQTWEGVKGPRRDMFFSKLYETGEIEHHSLSMLGQICQNTSAMRVGEEHKAVLTIHRSYLS
jgi:hypothetical protein